ncbi:MULTISPECIES: HAMP domain-containing sensor histidine kinase [Pantoea]|uniref:histidine kinase n=1 Tax=Candidatus Pantoea gossypiicola TaxID=2608008 RepID=A0AB34CII1_9GAMM|nr:MULTISPECIES: ATP-binding protein [Pantoea]KAA5928218.1 two-component sensor histidine kinase [Pantoea sp. VH_8]KAA5933298.1 two-component sensor histidine kinase [Pantoea sp. VH_4]KAA5985035.1 two-component sensor histidine kinase [Pantoea sp. M_4]KAA6122912.1 two-component sensor histidine kinase [Pantoea gossypiicola]
MKPFRFMRSLRNKLLSTLLIIHLLMIGGVTWYFFSCYGDMVGTMKDDQLAKIADAWSTNKQMPALMPMLIAPDKAKSAFVVQLWDDQGQLRASSWPELQAPLQNQRGYHDVHVGQCDDCEWRIFTRPGMPGSEIKTIQVMHNLSYMKASMVKRALSAIIPMILMMPLSLLVIWLVVRKITRDLQVASRQIAAQETHHPHNVSPEGLPDEILPLVAAYNSLLSKLRDAWSSQRQFLEDAAHELRTPVTAVTLQLENLRQHIQPGEASRQFSQLEAGVTRTRHLVTQLLNVSRQDDQSVVASVEHIELEDLLKESIEQLMVVADKRGIDIGFNGSTQYRLQASRSELRSLFDNLIGNAMLHTPEGSLVDVLLHRVAGKTVVDIVDNGPGMPESFIERAFDRFTRSPDVKAQGSGLGLSIVRNVAQKHQIHVALSNCLTPQGAVCGLQVRVTLP